MPDFGFDHVIDRGGTFSVKYDLRRERFGAEDILPMWVADMDFPVPPPVQKAIEKRSRHPIYGYTIRPQAYYAAIVRWLGKRHRWNVNTEWIQFSPGVVPALNLIIEAFSHPGDGIILQSPVYHPFFHAIKNNGRRLLNNQLVENGNKYSIDYRDLELKAKEAAILLLSHPHNPVGRSWRKEELLHIGKICLENNVLVVSDEIHADLTLNGHTHIPFASLSPEMEEITITCMAPSKTFNLAGLSTSSVIIKNKELRERFAGIMERFHLNMGNLFGMTASIAAYREGEPWLDALLGYVQENIDFVNLFIASEMPVIKVTPIEATYLLWLDFRDLNLSAENLKRFVVNKAKLGLNDGTMFGPGGEGFQRMNIACPRHRVIEAMNRLKDAIETL